MKKLFCKLFLILAMSINIVTVAFAEDEIIVGGDTSTAESLLAGESESEIVGEEITTEQILETETVNEETSQENVTEELTTSTNEDSNSNNGDSSSNPLDDLISIEDGNVEVAEVTVDDAVDYFKEKGWGILEIVQVVACIICIIVFVVSILWVVVGLFCKRTIGKGIVWMIVSGLCFVAILFAPQILAWFKGILTK